MNADTPNFERLIKKHLYGRPQQALVVVPPGFGAVVKDELLEILNTSVQPKPDQEMILSESESGHLKIENAELAFVQELLLRMRTASDIRLLIHRGRAAGYGALKRECGQAKLPLYFLTPCRVPLRVDAQASQVFVEREMAAVIETEFAKQDVTVVSGPAIASVSSEQGAKRDPKLSPPLESTLHARLFRDIFSLEVSLAGEPLAHRGYKANLVSIAPLREDLAACVLACVCAKLASWHLTPRYHAPHSCYVPFAGSGTFLFESWMLWADLPPFFFRSKYALEQLHFFKEAAFANLKKRIGARSQKNASETAPLGTAILPTHFVALEKITDQHLALQDNWKLFAQKLSSAGAHVPSCEFLAGDFFDAAPAASSLHGRVFVPLNPPYGLRLNAGEQGASDADFYARIGKQLVNLKQQSKGRISQLEGCILCANEPHWRAFLKALPTDAKTHTIHFTQGGIDVRLVTFLF